MRTPLTTLCLLVLAAGAACAQSDQVTDAERSHAGMMILLLVVGGMLLTYLLMWYLRSTGKLPEEKPAPRPLWVHPEDEDKR